MKMKRYFIWLLMSAKRLLVTPAFIILLCIIPLVVPTLKNVLTSDTSMARIVLASEDSGATVESIKKHLTDDEGVIIYSTARTPEAAVRAVETGKADAAWIFCADFDDVIIDYTEKRGEFLAVRPSLVRVVEREDSVVLLLSHEKLYGAMYKYIAFELCRDFIYDEIDSNGVVPEEYLREVFFGAESLGDIIDVEILNEKIRDSGASMTTTPLRGIIAVVSTLSAICAAMYFLKDEKEGKYDRLAPCDHIYPAFALIFSASFLSAAVALAAIFLSGLSLGAADEIISMVLFVFAESAFALVIAMVFNSYGKLGALTPGIVIAMLLLSPIFLNLRSLSFVGALFPTYHYLNSVYESAYIGSMIVYTVVAFALAFVCARIFKTKSVNRSMLI